MSKNWVPAPPPVVSPECLPGGPERERVKLLHVLTRFEAGAGGNTLLSALGMDPRRYEVWIAGSAGGPLWQRAEQGGIRTVQLRALRREVAPLADLAALVRLVSLIRRERFTIVHVHTAKGGFIGRLAAWLCRTPVVIYTLHGRDPWWPATSEATDLHQVMDRGLRTFLFLERALRPVTHGFVAVSPTVARDSVVARISAAGRIRAVPSAVDLDDIPEHADETVREELGVPPDVPLVGTVGRLDRQKAPLDFIRMASSVHARAPRARFVMVGEGELLDEARALAAELGVPVAFTGFRPDAARVASAFDVYVVSSLYEGVGRSVTEAMASGRAVVATAVDGIVDIVAPGSTGLLARPGDPESLAEGVLWMLDHPFEAARMGAQARTRIRALFRPSTMCALLDSLYSELLGESAGMPDAESATGSASDAARPDVLPACPETRVSA